MKKLLRYSLATIATVFVALCLWLGIGNWWPVEPPQPVARADQLLITGVNLVDVATGTVLSDTDILIEAGQITAIGNDLTEPSAVRLAAEGRFVIPGLFDMHVHSLTLSPVLTHPLNIAAGVTAVRDMGGCLGTHDSWVACADAKRAWSQAVEKGAMIGPRFDQVTSLAINGGSEIPSGFDRALGAGTPEGARLRVTHDAQRGIDFLKPYTKIPRDSYFALAESARAQGLYLAGHQPSAVSTIEAVDAGQRSIEHAFAFIWDCYPGINELRFGDSSQSWYTNDLRSTMIQEHDAEQCSEIHQRMVAIGAAYVPTHTTRKLDAYSSDPDYLVDSRLRWIPGPLKMLWQQDAKGMAQRAGAGGAASYRQFYEFGIQQTGVAHDAGVLVLAGTDAPDSYAFPGSALHDELVHLTQAGLTPIEALRAATIQPAAFLGLEGQAGEIKVGARADLVLLLENPLSDINAVRSIDAVILAGAVYDREKLDELLTGVEDAAGHWSMWPKLGWQMLNSPIMRKQFAD